MKLMANGTNFKVLNSNPIQKQLRLVSSPSAQVTNGMQNNASYPDSTVLKANFIPFKGLLDMQPKIDLKSHLNAKLKQYCLSEVSNVKINTIRDALTQDNVMYLEPILEFGFKTTRHGFSANYIANALKIAEETVKSDKIDDSEKEIILQRVVQPNPYTECSLDGIPEQIEGDNINIVYLPKLLNHTFSNGKKLKDIGTILKIATKVRDLGNTDEETIVKMIETLIPYNTERIQSALDEKNASYLPKILEEKTANPSSSVGLDTAVELIKISCADDVERINNELSGLCDNIVDKAIAVMLNHYSWSIKKFDINDIHTALKHINGKNISLLPKFMHPGYNPPDAESIIEKLKESSKENNEPYTDDKVKKMAFSILAYAPGYRENPKGYGVDMEFRFIESEYDMLLNEIDETNLPYLQSLLDYKESYNNGKLDDAQFIASVLRVIKIINKSDVTDAETKDKLIKDMIAKL